MQQTPRTRCFFLACDGIAIKSRRSGARGEGVTRALQVVASGAKPTPRLPAGSALLEPVLKVCPRHVPFFLLTCKPDVTCPKKIISSQLWWAIYQRDITVLCFKKGPVLDEMNGAPPPPARCHQASCHHLSAVSPGTAASWESRQA